MFRQVADRAGETVQLGHDELVSLPNIVEGSLKLIPLGHR
jgi:hypothetical protein